MAINYAPNYGSPYNLATYGNAYNPQMMPNMNNQINYSQQNSQQMNDGSMMAVFVQGEAGANAYPVASGNTVMLMDFESGKFWLKSNVNGIPQRLRSFSFSEEIQGQTQNQQISAVSREEFDKLADSVSKLIAELGGASNE